jgi:hypothetical protein
MPPQIVAGHVFSTLLPDNLINIIVRFEHTRYDRSIVVLNRASPAAAWGWNGPIHAISVGQTAIEINAIARRLRAAPQVRLSASEIDALQKKAGAAKSEQQRRWALKGGRGAPPFLVDVQRASGILVNDATGETLSIAVPGAASGMHLIQPDPLGDPKKMGWGRFVSKTADADPSKSGVFLLLEYGEVSPLMAASPRFLVACWIPAVLLKEPVKPIDFLVWYTPIPEGTFYPADRHPFGNAYPYQVWGAGAEPSDTRPVQRYPLLPLVHLSTGGPTGHTLTHLTAAAGKSTAIVVPVCPAAPQYAFEAFRSRAGVMRLLKEVCAYVGTLRQNGPAQYGGPPTVGKIGIAGLSAGVQNAFSLMSNISALGPYSDATWASSETTAFGNQWSEFWSFDAAFLGIKDPVTKTVKISGRDQFRGFLEACASWVQQRDDRHLRIYKTDFTAGANVGNQWDPRREPPGIFQRLLNSAAPLKVQFSDSPWAVSVTDSRRRFHCISVSEGYLRDPDRSTGLPEIPEGLEQFKKEHPGVSPTEYKSHHDAVPRIFLGHALLTSVFR